MKIHFILLIVLLISVLSSCKEGQNEDDYIYQNHVLLYFVNEQDEPLFTGLGDSIPFTYTGDFYSDDIFEPVKIECRTVTNFQLIPTRNPLYHDEFNYFLYFKEDPDTMNVKFIYDSEIDFYFQEITFQGVTYFEKYELLPERIVNDTLECGLGIIYHQD
jgi:hypothetical protein